MYKSIKDLQADLHVFMILLNFQLFAFFGKKQETVLSNLPKKLMYPGRNHTVIPLSTVQSCQSRTGRGKCDHIALLAVNYL